MKNITILIFTLLIFNTISQTTHTVNAGSFYYNPSQLTIDVGDSVVWVNDGGTHDVNGNINTVTGLSYNNPEVFDSPPTNVSGAVIYSHKFMIPGTYNYDCSVGQHAANGMVGSIQVNPSSGAVVEELNDEKLYIYPVPVETVLNIHGIELLKNLKSLSVFSLNGKKIIDFDIKNQSFDLSFLDNGIYFLAIEYGDTEKKSLKFSIK